MRAIALLATAGCVTALHPRGGELVNKDVQCPAFTLESQLGMFSLAETLQHDHVVLVFYRGHW